MIHKRTVFAAALLLLVGIALVAPKVLYACNLMSSAPQATCCCTPKAGECETGGGCAEHNPATDANCCDTAFSTSTSLSAAEDTQTLIAIESRFPDLPALVPTSSSLLPIASNRLWQRPLFNPYRPSGKQIYLTTARFRE